MSIESRIEELLAKQDIQEALARYARGIDRHDIELAKSAYHSDAYDEHGPARGNAHEVMDRVGATLAGLELSQHRITNVRIELDGDAAFVESYFHAIHVVKNSDLEEHVYGRYADRFERRDGGWKIAKRRVIMDFDSYRPKGAPSPYRDRFSLGARGREDPTYQRD